MGAFDFDFFAYLAIFIYSPYCKAVNSLSMCNVPTHIRTYLIL